MAHARTWLMGLVLLGFAAVAASAQGLSSDATSGAAGTAAEAPGTVVLLTLDGAIGPAAVDYLYRGLRLAARERSRLVVIQLDTPGGLDSSMRRIVKDILASPVPVATFVAPDGARAASAGTYILYASQIAAMAPATNLGAATPVLIGVPAPSAAPGEPAPDAMAAKRVADASAYIRSLAQLRGRNADWGEQAVRESVSLSAPEALKKNVITLIAQDVADLLRQVDGREVRTLSGETRLQTQHVQLLVIDADWRTRLLAVVTEPSLALVLLMVGIFGLLFEFSNPGFVLPGVVGAICLLLALFGLQMLPVNYVGLGLIFLGVAFLIAEAFVPSFGVLGVGGVTSFSFGALLLFDSSAPGFGIPLWLIALLAVVSAAFILLVGGVAARARRRPLAVGVQTLVGATGELIEYSNGEGWAQIQGDYWKVHGAGALRAGRRIRVTRVQGLELQVAEDNPEGPPWA
ncbi:MAG TPA: nodulation protein NfeD [Variovorax sp.]